MRKKEGRILIVDDDQFIRLSLKMLLENSYQYVDSLSDPKELVTFLSQHKTSVILLDMNFKEGDTSGKEGLYWLEMISDISPQTSVIVLTAYGDIEQAVDTLKAGAVDFISKPWQNQKLEATVSAAFSLSTEKKKVKFLEQRESERSQNASGNGGNTDIIWGESQEMDEIRQMIKKVAATNTSVLITGENGTGKEMIAREIHRQSHRSNEVFFSVDLGSISDSLFESEMFGHQKGSFTGATENRIGKFQAAENGTLFLDEIGNLSPEQQAKLLTALQRSLVVPLGSNEEVKVNARVICATNANLEDKVANREFREDLWYRINTIEIQIPSLRQRKIDIPLLVKFFIDKYGKRYQKNLVIGESTLKDLKFYSWPGNIRELEHAVERAVILSNGNEITTEDFKLRSGDRMAEDFDDYNLENIEAWAIRKALIKYDGNVSKAASELGLSRGSLYRRMEKYGL